MCELKKCHSALRDSLQIICRVPRYYFMKELRISEVWQRPHAPPITKPLQEIKNHDVLTNLHHGSYSVTVI